MPPAGQDAMNKLSKEKRNQLILVGMITVAGLIGLWFGLISFQLDYLKGIAARTADAQKTRIKQDQEIKDANKVQAELEVASKRVAELEEDMGPPDLSSWVYDTIRRF